MPAADEAPRACLSRGGVSSRLEASGLYTCRQPPGLPQMWPQRAFESDERRRNRLAGGAP
jgi:hypothetical protein